jgi:hypothetical protein
MSDDLASVEIHYRLPEKKDLHFFHAQCPYNYLEFREMEPYLRFATSVALFGSMLHMSGHVRYVTWEQELTFTRENMDPLNQLHKEFYDLIMKAQKIYGPLRRRKRWDEE